MRPLLKNEVTAQKYTNRRTSCTNITLSFDLKDITIFIQEIIRCQEYTVLHSNHVITVTSSTCTICPAIFKILSMLSMTGAAQQSNLLERIGWKGQNNMEEILVFATTRYPCLLTQEQTVILTKCSLVRVISEMVDQWRMLSIYVIRGGNGFLYIINITINHN